MNNRYLIVVGGPTAAGKTGWAIRLARYFGTEILSADSRQFFREMSIGTAKPTAEELRQAPHHFINHLSVTESYSVGDFEREAMACLNDLFQKHEVVILTGGSGLYLQALCRGLDIFPEVPLSVRREVEEYYESNGLPALQEELRRVDPGYFAEVDTSNPARLMRALAVCRASGRPYSSFRRQTPAPRHFTPIYLQLHWPRADLYQRIDRRVDDMLEQGLVDEARRLYPFRHQMALQTVGYQELFDFFEGKCTLDEAVILIKRNSRRYAKRQLTWMRRDGHWKHIGPREWDLALRYIELVRTTGRRIAPLPGDAPELAGLPIDYPRPHTWVCLLNGPEIEAALPMYFLRDLWFINVEKILTEYKNILAEESLWHEAVQITEDAPVYAPAPEGALRVILQGLGFREVAGLPYSIREGARLPGSADLDKQTWLFREGAPGKRPAEGK